MPRFKWLFFKNKKNATIKVAKFLFCFFCNKNCLMKKIKAVLGLTQDEVGLYLGVSRSQWPLFVTGKRKPRRVKSKNFILHFQNKP